MSTATGRDVRFKYIHMKINATVYMEGENGGRTEGISDPDSAYPDGTWKFKVVSGDLVFYKKISGSWVEKGAFE